MARFGCIGSRNQNNFDARCESFIVDQSPEIKERPRVGQSTLFFASRLKIRSLSDAAQILQSNNRISCQRRAYKVLANNVVSMFLESSFASRQPFQEFTAIAPCTPCAFRCASLNRRSQLYIKETYAAQVAVLRASGQLST